MADSIGTKLKHAWNAFTNQDDERQNQFYNAGATYGVRPDRPQLGIANERSIITSVYTRLAIDSAAIDIKHIRQDQNGRFLGQLTSGLNDCLTLEANLDQSARQFRQDIFMTMFGEGVICVVPVDTTFDITRSSSWDIRTMRVGIITQWFPKAVRVNLYNEVTGLKEEVTLPKKSVAVAENPLYAVMNEQNSTLQRLIRKLNLLDDIDDQSGSGKLDLIIQLPYTVKSDARKALAATRTTDIEMQLKGSKYGIAYIDGTEKVTQLNRPAENNLLAQITYLTAELFAQLGLTASVFDGTADEATMINYYNRTIEPLVASVVDAMKRSFITKTARSQGQSIGFFRDPFKLVSISDIAEIADKFTRNEILSSNDIRAILGWMPSADPKADELRNKNLNQSTDEAPVETPKTNQEIPQT